MHPKLSKFYHGPKPEIQISLQPIDSGMKETIYQLPSTDPHFWTLEPEIDKAKAILSRLEAVIQ